MPYTKALGSSPCTTCASLTADRPFPFSFTWPLFAHCGDKVEPFPSLPSTEPGSAPRVNAPISCVSSAAICCGGPRPVWLRIWDRLFLTTEWRSIGIPSFGLALLPPWDACVSTLTLGENGGGRSESGCCLFHAHASMPSMLSCFHAHAINQLIFTSSEQE